MKKSRINKDIYKLSQTLYGSERFKLCLEAIKKTERENRYNLDDIPDISFEFADWEEEDDYRKIAMDFLVMNFSVYYVLMGFFNTCISYILSTEDEEIRGDKGLLIIVWISMQDFFATLDEVKKINEEYDVDLFTYGNRDMVDFWARTLEQFNPMYTAKLRKIYGFSQKEMDAFKETDREIFKNPKSFVPDLFFNFRRAGNIYN